MLDTPNSPETQAPTEGHAQAIMPMGPAIEAARVRDVAMQLAVFRAAVEAIVKLPHTSWADKGFLVGLVCRLDFARGVVSDSHEWLAKWFSSSKGAIRKRREALAAAGHTIERQVQDEVHGGNLTSEIALPMLARVALDVAAKGGVSENGHRGCPKPGTKEVGVSSDREEVPYSTLPDGSGEGVFDASHPLVVLKNWRQSKFFRERGEAFTAEPNLTAVDFDEWRVMLGRYGGAPPQATTGAALRQAIEIAHEVHASNLTGQTLPIRHIVAAIACAIAQAHAKRKKIASLGFIAERLVRGVSEECDATPIYDLPITIEADAYAQAHEVASTLLSNDSRGALAREPLMATVEVEELAGIIAEHGGVHTVHVGWAYACWQNKWPEKGTVYVSWRWLVPAIEAAKTNPKQPAWWRKA